MWLLPSVDLSAAAPGKSGFVSLNNVGVSAGGVSANPSLFLVSKQPVLWMYNESGMGLQITFQGGTGSTPLPAGAWIPFSLAAGESGFTWVVEDIIPGGAVNTLKMAYYSPGEAVPFITALGNSPLGGGFQNVANSTISNEGQGANVLVIDIGDTTLAQLWKVWTDHFNIQVDQSGTIHQVIAGSTTGNPLQLGQSGDKVEVLGTLLSDQNIMVTSTAVATQSGSTSGTATVYMDERGTIKRVLVVFANFQQGAGTLSKIVLPVVFTTMAQWVAGNIVGVNTFLGAGAAISMNEQTGIQTYGASTRIDKFTTGDIPSSFDTIQITNNNASAATGVLSIVGV